METNGCAAVPGEDGRLLFYASTQMPHGLHGQLAGALKMDRSRHPRRLPAGRWRLRRQGRDLRRVLGGRRGRPPPRPAGVVVAGPQRRPRVAPPQPGPDPVRRARRRPATARSPGCASTSSATPARTRASARSCRPARSGCRTARTASRRSSSTSPSPSRTRRRRAPTAAPGARRPRRCSSASSTTPPTSSASTRSSCAAATCSPTTCSRSRRSPASPTTPAPTRTPLDVGRRGDRLRRPAQGAGRAPRANGDAHRARHRRRRLRRDHGRRRRQGVRRRRRSTTTARPRCAPGRSPTARATRRRSP